MFTCAGTEAAIADLVLDLRSIKAQYYRFGIQLRVPPHEIMEWEQEFQRDANGILGEILNFLFANYRNPIELLYTALLKIDQAILAEELKLKYGGAQGNNVESCVSIDILYANGKKKSTGNENKGNIWSSVMFLFITINSEPLFASLI